MSIISRYIFRQALGALLLILLSLTGVVWIALALKQLNLVTSQGADVWRLLAITTLAVPNLMALIAPIALLIATIHTLNRLNTDSELIVLTASGATVWTVARPLLLLAAIVALGVSAVNHAVMPWSLRMLRSMILEVRTDLLSQVIQPGRFSSPEAGVTIHIRDRGLDGVLRGILMHDTRDAGQHLSYLAETGTLTRQDASAFLTMSNGHILRRPTGDEPVQIIAFARYAIDLEGFERKAAAFGGYKPREHYTHELFAPDTTLATYKEAPGQFRAELHERFATATLSDRLRPAGRRVHRPGPEHTSATRTDRGHRLHPGRRRPSRRLRRQQPDRPARQRHTADLRRATVRDGLRRRHDARQRPATPRRVPAVRCRRHAPSPSPPARPRPPLPRQAARGGS